jgi:hypothetical protein
MKKPEWMSVKVAEQFELDFMGGPRITGEDWRLVEIREIPGTTDEVNCIIASQKRGERTIPVPVSSMDDPLLIAALWNRLEYLS